MQTFVETLNQHTNSLKRGFNKTMQQLTPLIHCQYT